MPYSNDYTQITSGLVNYIGAMISALPDSVAGRGKAQLVVGDIMKQVVLLSQKDSDTEYDIYILKPVIRSLIYVFEREKERMSADLPFTKHAVQTYDTAIQSLQRVLDMMEETTTPSAE
jgi:hypothetical protein